MKTQIQQLLVVTSLLVAAPVLAQLVNDGGTNTLSNGTNSFAGDVFVGTNGSFTLLVLSNNCLLTNSADGYIGFFATAKSNEVRLVSASARWLMNGALTVGYRGAFNRLTVSNGALVTSSLGSIGDDDRSASNNMVIVNGPGSVWSNASSVIVGNFGLGNALEVSAGGLVSSGGGTIGGVFGNNRALVTGANSIWNNRNDLTIGYSGGNQLVVSNGGLMLNTIGYLGRGSGGSNNLALVTGAGSLWTNQSDLYVGLFDKGNQLVVSNGGMVVNTIGYLGGSTASSNNLAVVTGAGSLWLNQSDLRMGDTGAGNQLVVTNGGAVFTGGNGVLGVNGGVSSNSALINGSGSRWLLGGALSTLFVGSNGSFNQMTISGGALVADRDGLLGGAVGGSNNTAVVNGMGSYWSNSSSVSVGGLSTGNRLDVGSFGLIEDDFGTVGSVSSANYNEVVVHDPGATWSNHYDLNVGYSGSFNRLTVTNGGLVFAGAGVYVGAGPLSINNRVAVDGGTLRATNASGTAVLDVRRGTNVLNAGTIDVDRLVLTNTTEGAFEFNGGTLITRGIAITSTNPFPVYAVSGNGATPATWDVRAGVSNHFLPGTLFVGSNSSFNRLLITNGALLTNAFSGAIGINAGANSNTVLLSGAGSVWSVGGTLLVGDSGSANQLVVSNGAQVVNQSEGQIGANTGSRDNTALVTGAGSVWSSLGNLYIGYQGAGNRLVISNGGTVFVPGNVFMAATINSTNNRIVVDGGMLRVTNADGSATLNVQRGTNALNAGWLEVNRLLVVAPSGSFEFNGGTLKPGATTCGNGRIFTVGDGARVATLQLAGGAHGFTNGLLIANNATLTGYGTVAGTLTVSSGGTLSPGDGIGTLVLTSPANLQGAVIMEAFKLGASRFNDQVQVTGTLIYGGSLTVSNVGVAAFALGDNFKLFSATAYAGSFVSLNLPPLSPGLGWTNKLLVDGSIEVVAAPQPKFSNISVSGTNVIISGTNGLAGANYAMLTATNLALPLSNWVTIATSQFDSGGNFSFTNAIAPGIPQRFFRIRTP